MKLWFPEAKLLQRMVCAPGLHATAAQRPSGPGITAPATGCVIFLTAARTRTKLPVWDDMPKVALRTPRCRTLLHPCSCRVTTKQAVYNAPAIFCISYRNS
jgi:hypothetical protein